MTATTRLLLEAAHGTSDPAVLADAAKGGSVTPDAIRRIAEVKIPEYSRKFGEPVFPDSAVKIVQRTAREMAISVTDRP